MEVWFKPPIAPTTADVRMILVVKALISIRYDININGAAFCTVISSAQFSHLNPSITPGNHQWSGAAPLFSRRGVQMIIGVCAFSSRVNKSSVNVFITTINSRVAEARTCTMKYFSEASVLYMFLALDIRGINDIRLISSPIHAPSHELDDTDINTPLTKVVNKRILVEFLGIREESFTLFMGYEPISFFSLLFCFKFCLLHLGVWCTLAFDA